MTATFPPAPFQPENTFSNYNKEQGKAYAEIRRDYHPNVYNAIITQHTSTGGKLITLVDIGCGPGLATLALAPRFTHAIGLDPSAGMIAIARSQLEGQDPPSPSNIRFEISTAEELGSNLIPPVADSSVDLITASNAAHWFNMSGFWPSAARILKPGGSVAMWTSGAIRAHPSMPNAPGIQAAMDAHQAKYLDEYRNAGNQLAGNAYRNLPLPWTLEKVVPEFDEGTFFRKDWDVGEEFFIGAPEVGFGTFEKMMATSSAVTRWREAHPDAVGEEDVVRILRREMERILHEAGVKEGEEKLKGDVRGALLVVKKKM
jgi:SAM-dependent methyltransferase